jgi:hypothetical protein
MMIVTESWYKEQIKIRTEIEVLRAERDDLLKANELLRGLNDNLTAEQNRLRSELDYTHTERDTVVGYLKDKEVEITALKAELSRLRGLPNVARMEQIAMDNDSLLSLKAERDKLRAFVVELTNSEHQNPPVPLWIELKARALTEPK